MNSTPAASKARLIAISFAGVSDVSLAAVSARWMVASPKAAIRRILIRRLRRLSRQKALLAVEQTPKNNVPSIRYRHGLAAGIIRTEKLTNAIEELALKILSDSRADGAVALSYDK
jgi:hypothetical protein